METIEYLFCKDVFIVTDYSPVGEYVPWNRQF